MPDRAMREALVATLAMVDGMVSAYLFGSAASGRAHRESDVDVGVLLDREVHRTRQDRFDLRLRLIGRLAAVAGRDVDVVVLNDASPGLGRHIMTAGDRLLVRDPALDHSHLGQTLSRAADLEPFLRRTRALTLRALADDVSR
jgi:predicted nucleotidyltransferase